MSNQSLQRSNCLKMIEHFMNANEIKRRLEQADAKIKITKNPWSVIDWVSVYCSDVVTIDGRYPALRVDFKNLGEDEQAFRDTRKDCTSVHPWFRAFYSKCKEQINDESMYTGLRN